MLIISYMGDHVWLITSRQTEPDLYRSRRLLVMYSLGEPGFLLSRPPYTVPGLSLVLMSTGPSEATRVVHLQLVYVGVEYAVREADAGRLVGVLVGQLDVDLPDAALERCCSLLVSLCRSAGPSLVSVTDFL